MKKKIVLFISIISIFIINVMPAFCGTIGHSIGGSGTAEFLSSFSPAGTTYTFPDMDFPDATVSNASAPTTPVATPAPKPVEKACEHDYVSEITKQPTCAEEGETTYTCTLCGESYTEPIAKSTIHDYQKEVTKEMTCLEDGEETYTCSICGDTYTETVPTIGHQYSSEVTTPATCLKDGEVTYTCSVCGDTYAEVAPAKGHTEGEWEISKPAGLFTTGEQVIKCTECGEILETQLIPSQYPVWYIYIAIAMVLAIVAVVVPAIIRNKRNK